MKVCTITPFVVVMIATKDRKSMKKCIYPDGLNKIFSFILLFDPSFIRSFPFFVFF